MSDDVREPVKGDGYAIGSLEGMGEGPGFRKIRRELGVGAFGVNAIVLPAGIETGRHYHERQEELYFVHSGRVEIEFGDGVKHSLGPGGMAWAAPEAVREIRNHGPDDAVYVVVGAEGGYVGRDGKLPDGEDSARARPIGGGAKA